MSTSDVSIRVRAAAVRAVAHLAQVLTPNNFAFDSNLRLSLGNQVVPYHSQMPNVFSALLKSRYEFDRTILVDHPHALCFEIERACVFCNYLRFCIVLLAYIVQPFYCQGCYHRGHITGRC